MYAVVNTGGKQVRLQAGDLVRLEYLPGDVGDPVELSDIRLLVDGKTVIADSGSLSGARVKGLIRGQGRGKKIVAFRFKRRKKVRRKRGHRQAYTQVEVTEVLA